MNPSPDRGKECLPPKKRESRQGSAEQRPPLDEFKPPAVPPRTRPAGGSGRGEGGRESSGGAHTHSHSLLSSPTPPLPPPGIHIPMPWLQAYPPPFPLHSNQVGERRGSSSPSWRDAPLLTSLHSRWLQGEIPLTVPPCSSSSSSFKSPFPADSREVWPCFNTGRRDYCSSTFFSPSPLFSQPSLYPPDTSLTEGRRRYLGKRPNGLDGPGSKIAPGSRAGPPSGEYGKGLSGRASLGGGPHTSHTADERRRHSEDPAACFQPDAVFHDSRAPPLEGPDSHSSPQDRDPRTMLKARSSALIPTGYQPHGAEPQTPRRGESLNPVGDYPSEAQIYYSLGSMYPTLPPSHLSPQAQVREYPGYSSSGSPLYGLPSMKNSQRSPQGQPNSHSADRDRDGQRDRDGERDRDGHKDRELSPGRLRYPRSSPLLPPPNMTTSPPQHRNPRALLPHFAKGSLIELAGGRLKLVEELRTEDFLRSADTSPEFHLSTCTVLLITPSNTHGFNHLQVLLTDRNTQELLTVLVEYPFFVRDRGWSSCCPQKTSQLYGLSCHQLSEGDICLALTPTSTPRTHARAAPRGHCTPTRAETGVGTHREDMPPPPPPPPLPLPSQGVAPAPHLRPNAADPRARERPRPRKRRWSAPDLFPPTGTAEATRTVNTTDLPHGSKQRKWQ
ncbi:ataxin-1-like [Esox lucius]|uniref:AXH domain-containing protein n=1 Tax=Esox lucius TaxID=8010 RepID=A0A6Q2YEJ8_ESOLU|nr:ataxin-1-like [Esox lucius]XP_028980184.1 ataxin-1-like [Esox lucius]